MSSIINSADKFKSDILAMISSGTSNDVKILLEDEEEILANKDVLCARSDYFSTMFRNNNKVSFVEGETNKVDMTHCSKVVMEKIIKYLFSGDMTLHDLCLPDLVKMMNMTSMMMMDDTHSFIKDYVLELIPESGDNCACLPDIVNSLMLAENFGLEDIKEALVHKLFMSLKVVPQIPEVVQNSEAFKMLPTNLVKEIFLHNQHLELKDEDETSDDDDLEEKIQKPNLKRKRRPSESKTKRAGLVFPVSKINRRIKKGKYARRVGEDAGIFMAAATEYLVAELVELSGKVAEYHNRERIIPHDIHVAIVSDEELMVLNNGLSSVTLPSNITKKGNGNDDEDYVEEEDNDYSQPDDTDDDDYEEDGDDAGEIDITDNRWVGDNDRLNAFLYWLSGNECSDEDKKEIISSFNLLCGCFTAENLLTDVKKSGLFSSDVVDNSVLEIIRHVRKEIKTEEDKCGYLGMLGNENY